VYISETEHSVNQVVIPNITNYCKLSHIFLSQYGYKKTGGAVHIPAGWDWWIGLVGNSRYYNYTLSVNGTAVFHSDDYLTDVIVKYQFSLCGKCLV
jgi:hypothetical protein